MERASMRATGGELAAARLRASRFGKLRVVWRMLKALFAGVSPAPKQGPQKAVLNIAPGGQKIGTAPLRTKSMYTGWDDG